MRFDTSMENLIGIGRSESFADLNFAKNIIGSSSNLMSTSGDCRYHYHDDDLFNSKNRRRKKKSHRFSIFFLHSLLQQATSEAVIVSAANLQLRKITLRQLHRSHSEWVSWLCLFTLNFPILLPLLPIGARIKKKQRKRKANEKQRKRSEIHHLRKK